jgi:flavin reductase (DIM6/NTAB) family NADH-FMN oxidoreductase RutF
MIAVRDSRHTFTIIEKAADYTVSVPTVPMGEEIMFCGTKSGRDVNKFEALNLKTKASREVESPIIDTAGIHFECRIIFKSAMDPLFLDAEYDRKLYPDKDYHTLYFGEIKACYELS